MSRARNLADLLDANGDVASGALDSQPQLGRRNLIINGAMQVWQRGTSITHAYSYNADRWHNRTGTTVTWSRSTTVPDGFIYSNECSAAGSIAQGVELQATGVAGQFYAGSTYTLSVWSTVEPTAQVDFADDFGPSNPSNWGSGAMTSTGETSNGFTRYTQTYTVPAINGTNTMVFVKLAFASAVKYTGVQLEVGSVATPFEHRSYGEELALCQRYFQVIGHPTATQRICTSFGWTTGMAMVSFLFPYEMRVAPSVSATDGTKGLLEAGASYFTTSIAGNASAPKGASLLFYASGLTQYRPYMTTMMPGYYLQFDAEL